MNSNDKVFMAFLTGGVLMMYILPDSLFLTDSSICMHYKIFGIQCPFCGLTRAAHALLHLNISESIRLNMATIPLSMLILNEMLRRITKVRYFTVFNRMLLIGTACVFILLYIHRILVSF